MLGNLIDLTEVLTAYFNNQFLDDIFTFEKSPITRLINKVSVKSIGNLLLTNKVKFMIDLFKKYGSFSLKKVLAIGKYIKKQVVSLNYLSKKYQDQDTETSFEIIFPKSKMKNELKRENLTLNLKINTENIDQKKVEILIFELYKKLGKKPPKIFFYNQLEKDFLNQVKIPQISEIIINSLTSKEGKEIITETAYKLSEFLALNIANISSFDIERKSSKNLDLFLVKNLEKHLGKRIITSFFDEYKFWEFRHLLNQEEFNNVARIFDTFNIIKGNISWHFIGDIHWNIIEPYLANEEFIYDETSEKYLSHIAFHLTDLYHYLTPNISLFNDFFYQYFTTENNQEQKIANILQNIFDECGFILAYENFCFIGNNPKKILLDEQYRLHGMGETALEYSDILKEYYFHGVRIPPEYGKIEPKLWSPRWLLTEKNAEVRRVLIQEIGYSKICQELNAQIIDQWREYSLLLIKDEIDIEPIYLLKMTCPSTNLIHIIRVPPTIETAKDAIKWVNWDINPEDFISET